MKKLMTAMLALAFLCGTVAVAQQDPPKAEKSAKKKTAKKKTSKRKAEEPKQQ
jgi:Ni/Co efflux regulator RcnB